MSRWLREFRLVPIVLIAVGCLFALKALGLVFDGGYTLGQRLGRTDSIVVTTITAPPATIELQSPSVPLDAVAAAQQGNRPWMQQMFAFPEVTGSVARPPMPPTDRTIVTGSTGGARVAAAPDMTSAVKTPEPAAKPPTSDTKPPEPKPPETRPAAGAPTPIDPVRSASGAERAILERLHERRQEIEARARELEIRESLLKAAEKKLEARLAELKEVEARYGPGGRKEESEAARFKSLVTMYETMKPKEAAKIFDRLDLKVLIEVATQINPRTMSAILAQMSPEAAERLTVELATRASAAERAQNPANLPKIDGKPSGG
jgi:flagellar motility protein MotE (MotC chaperone)